VCALVLHGICDLIYKVFIAYQNLFTLQHEVGDTDELAYLMKIYPRKLSKYIIQTYIKRRDRLYS
jgi:hypothetical protein